MDKKFLIIGLTGGSGTGKTIISETFLKHNIPVIDADKVARDVAAPGSDCLKELSEYFGNKIIGDDGTLRRRHLANIAFSDPEKTQNLNRITHKYIKIGIDKLIEEAKQGGFPGIIIDAPALIESNLFKRCDKVICVISKKQMRIKRIMERDGLTKDEAMVRLGAQHDDEFYIKNSDYTIINDGHISSAVSQAEAIIRDIFFKT